jgi:glutamate/tyrosine decarboxylase-like PLP-dependent enzyme
VAYVSDQAHASIARAARALGFRPEHVRVLPTGLDHRLEPATLAAAMQADVRAGRRPLFVSASGGATNTGAVDPLPELAALTGEHEAWLHVDAAYGGFAALTERGRRALEGIELADSVTLDPHKWLYQPFECGCLLVREGGRLRRAFQLTPDYLAEAGTADGEVNFEDRGLQLTRTSRALKVWISVRYFGLDAFRAAINRSLDLAALAQARVEASPVLEPAARPSLGIVCLRRRFEQDEDELNAGLVEALERSGLGLVSSTRLHGRVAIRLCPLNHTSTAADIERVLDFLERAEPEPVSRPALSRDRDMSGIWLRNALVDREALAGLPLFASLGADEFERVARLAHVREAAPGERIIERWSISRDFFVVLDGSVAVFRGNEWLADLGRGEGFGEIALLRDVPRTADVARARRRACTRSASRTSSPP